MEEMGLVQESTTCGVGLEGERIEMGLDDDGVLKSGDSIGRCGVQFLVGPQILSVVK